MAELKKCPFCGGEAEVVKAHSGVAMFPYTVVCKSDECSASVGVFKETRGEAIEAWNNRVNEAKIITAMSKAMKEYYPSCKGAYRDFDVFFHAVMAKVVEQLKEE